MNVAQGSARPDRVRAVPRGRGMRGAVVRASVAALAVVLLVAGCAQIPRSSAVKDVGTVEARENGLGQVDFLPNRPQDGATQEQILSGFIQAAVSPQGDYDIARDFLTTGFATRWNPDASVTVDKGSDRDYSTVNAMQKQLTLTPAAFVDSDGSYSRAESSAEIQQQYTFVKQKGQWRISKAPNGVIIDEARFSNVFSAHSLYFFSPDLTYLVPDQRWFPNSPTSLQTRVVKQLVQGPAKWLDGAYVSAFPQGSQLTSDSVTVTGGEADVDLNSTAGSVDAPTLARMQLQLTESLGTVANVDDVRISIEGVQRTVPNALPAPLQNPSVDSNALVQRSGKFGLLSGTTVTEIPDVSSKVESLGPLAATLSADHSTAAVLTSHGSFVVRADDDDPVSLDTRSGLIAPTLDPAGYAWSAVSSSPSDVSVLGPGGAALRLPVTWPNARSVIAIAMSRDGTRLAALVESEGSTEVMVAGIVRTSSGRPDGIGTPIELGPVPAGKAHSLTWIDDLSVATLVALSEGDSTVATQSVGGESLAVPGPNKGVSLGPVGSAPYYWVLTSTGSLEWPRGTGWQQRVDGVQFIGQQLGKPQ